MGTTISVVCRRQVDLVWLRRIRAWSAQYDLSQDAIECVEAVNSLPAAIEWQADRPEARLIVAVGFDQHDLEKITRSKINHVGEPIVLTDRPAPTSAVIARTDRTAIPEVLYTEDIIDELRRVLVRMSANTAPQVRKLATLDEVRSYLGLRYRIWKANGYIPKDRVPLRATAEIDHTDRNAVPYGAFATNGELIGCARLVRAFGREDPCFVRLLEDVVEEANDPVVRRNFEPPRQPNQPFDLLVEFRGFQAYYRSLLRQRIRMGEVSRVIVEPRYRGRGIAKSLVGALVSAASDSGIKRLFLACSEEIKPLYESCGFEAVEGLVSDKFINIPVRSVLMERRL